MNRILKAICLVIVFSQAIQAQEISLIPLHTEDEYFFIDHLWQVNILNQGNSRAEGRFEIKLEDKYHNLIFKSEQLSMNIEVGLLELPFTARAAMQNTYASNQLGNSLRASGKLPFGQYILCYSFFSNSGTTMGSQCIEKNVLPIAMPELIDPVDGGLVEGLNPILLWRGPYPLENERLRYSLRLCEVPNGMAPLEAMRTRPMLLNMQNLYDQILLYPISAQPLDTGKTYAWQVAATAEEFSLGTTDIWTFKISPNKPDTIKKQYLSYCWMKEEEDGSYCYPSDTLKFVYENPAGDSILNYRIITEKNDTITNLPKIGLKQGLNFLQLSLRKLDNMRSEEVAILEIISTTQRRYFLPFRQRKYSD